MSRETDELFGSLMMREATISDPIKYGRVVYLIETDAARKMIDAWPNLEGDVEHARMAAESFERLEKTLRGDNYVAKRKTENRATFGSLDDLFDGSGSQNRVLGPISILKILFEAKMEILESIQKSFELINGASIISLDDARRQAEEDLGSTALAEEVSQALMQRLTDNSRDALQSLALEQQINRGATIAYTASVEMLLRIPRMYQNMLANLYKHYTNYFDMLRHRHSVEGEPMTRDDVILTDVAMLVWANIDKMGEIEHGSNREELSAFTIQRVKDLVDALRDQYARDMIFGLVDIMLEEARFNDILESIHAQALLLALNIGLTTWSVSRHRPSDDLQKFERDVELFDLKSIAVKPSAKATSRSELFAREHKAKCIERVATALYWGDDINRIANTILDLKIEEQKFLYQENGFFVCTIGAGNPFGGESPGSLQVIPGERPHADLEFVWGSGFDGMRDYIRGMKDSQSWSNLFLVTSPSCTTDKNNVLLVGPQGCGKTELLRAVAAEGESISIFAIGSDFLTCWLGEAQKNPKRLFEAAIKIRKASNMHVHILIDEVDMVLNDDGDLSRRVDLSLEFQNLMDGIVSYPGITVWGATNHPQRIPTPMLRRFSKIEVVGEMSLGDRIETLRHYIESFLPVEDGLSDHYEAWAGQMDGCTGDIIRKVIDEVWMRLMRAYISDHEDHATEALKMLDGMNVFDITDELRQQVMDHISEHARVSPELVEDCMDLVLGNPAVRQQINVARRTYADAHTLFDTGPEMRVR